MHGIGSLSITTCNSMEASFLSLKETRKYTKRICISTSYHKNQNFNYDNWNRLGTGSINIISVISSFCTCFFTRELHPHLNAFTPDGVETWADIILKDKTGSENVKYLFIWKCEVFIQYVRLWEREEYFQYAVTSVSYRH